MFEIAATIIFVTAFALSITVMATMFATYRDKMIAALLAQPVPQIIPTYTVEVRRRRVTPIRAQSVVQCASVARAA